MPNEAELSLAHGKAAGKLDNLMSKLRIRDLALLKEIAITGSLTDLAKKMEVSQPAISRMLHEIEVLFGMKLFQRIQSVGVVPTQAGKIVLSRAEILLADVESLSSDLDAFENGRGGHLRLGLIPFISDQFSQRLILCLLSDQYRMSISIHEGSTDQLISLMQSAKLDAVIGRSNAAFESANLAQEKIFTQKGCLIVHPDNEIAKNGKINWEKLRNYTWLLPPRNSPTRLAISELFASKGVAPPAAVIETSSARTIHALVSARPNMVGVLPSDIGRDLESWGGVFSCLFPSTFYMPTVSVIYPVKNRNLSSVRGLRGALKDLLSKGMLLVN
ncbi:MAG: LysR family transcriptional regulator [Candidimonas sp.]|nr:MAG: LysR family transcriptional regulator [Candidimonas sp.]TAM74827.1 MAG: LysR family transcriptional regulator [Candidimonas sp.]